MRIATIFRVLARGRDSFEANVDEGSGIANRNGGGSRHLPNAASNMLRACKEGVSVLQDGSWQRDKTGASRDREGFDASDTPPCSRRDEVYQVSDTERWLPREETLSVLTPKLLATIL